MDLEKIRSWVNENRPLAAINSFPILLRREEELEIMWFNYYIEEKHTFIVDIRDVFVANNEMRLVHKPMHVKLPIKVEAYDRPEIGEEEYFKLLQELLDHYSEEEMLRLLSCAELKPLLTVYGEIDKQLKSGSIKY